MSLEAVLRWAEHVRDELGSQSTITVKPVSDFADEAPAESVSAPVAPSEAPAAPDTPTA